MVYNVDAFLTLPNSYILFRLILRMQPLIYSIPVSFLIFPGLSGLLFLYDASSCNPVHLKADTSTFFHINNDHFPSHILIAMFSSVVVEYTTLTRSRHQ